jgi:CheY-like chemotaxis protein
MASYELSIDTAASGFETIDKIKGGSVYDIIFMDHMMPKMDGIEAVKIMRGLGYMHPIVALTANALVGQEEMFLNNGFDGFISKPIDVRQLNDSLNKLVRDKQPYEVIEAARRQKAARQTQEKTSPLIAPPSPESFVRDAERVVSTLEIICKNEFRRANDIKIFTITVQSIKGSLANIGETELSAAAFRLEQAGQNQDIARMSAETPEFLQALNEAIKKYTSEGGGIESEDEDMPFLHEKLLIIQAACAIRDKKTAKDALVELKRKTWSRPTKDMLNAVIEYVLQGNFEEAVSLTRDYDSAQFK